jgi:uncharacterized protein YjbI with pentapeptide repeats
VTWFWLCGLLDSGADLSDADLRGADFSLANLTKVKCSALHNVSVQFHQDSIQARLSTRLYSILFKIPDKYLILIQNVQPSLNQTFIFGPILFMLLSYFTFYETKNYLSIDFRHGDSFFNTLVIGFAPFHLQTNLSNANLEGALVTGNTSFKGANITGAGK